MEKYIHGLFPSGASASSPWQTTPTRRSGQQKARQINGLINEVVSGGSVGEHHGLRHEAAAGAVHRRLSIYGYRKDPDNKGHLLVDPEAAEVVRQIFRWSLEGHGKQSIARMLNDLGVVNPTRYKAEQGWDSNHFCKQDFGLWNKNTVWRILRNEIYTGVMVQGRTKRASYKSKAIIVMPRDRWFRVEDSRAIIDRETFETVQRNLDIRSREDGTGMVHPGGAL